MYCPVHFSESHRKASNFDVYRLHLSLLFHQKIIYHLKENWPSFSLSVFRSSNYVITIVKQTYSKSIKFSSANFHGFLKSLVWTFLSGIADFFGKAISCGYVSNHSRKLSLTSLVLIRAKLPIGSPYFRNNVSLGFVPIINIFIIWKKYFIKGPL